MYDIVIIGAGVSGCAVARELSRYELNICVVDRESDVCEGTSKANSAIVHAGFDAKYGSLKAKLNVQGSQMMEKMSEILDFPFKRNGAMVVCQNASEIEGLEKLLERGEKNGVRGMRIITGEEAHELEPNLADTVCAALHVPDSAIICPFQMNIAYAENAAVNGVEFRLGTEVQRIEKCEGMYRLFTSKGVCETKMVINAAGVYADVFHNMVSEQKIHITARRGEYCLFDKNAGGLVSHTVFQLPGEMGKGVLVTPTVHGNLLVGPTAADIEDKDGTCTTGEGIRELMKKSERSVKNIPFRQVITSFAGLRAHEDGDEFLIGEVEDAKGFIDVAGIESPGLSSAPAVGVYVKDIVTAILRPEKKADFTEQRKGFTPFMSLTRKEQEKLLKEEPAYGKIVCRCEKVTEGEILEAIHRPLGATTLDGIKRRTRAGMGRCQAGFCTSRTMEILARELDMKPEEICKSGTGSKLIVGVNKDAYERREN